MNAEIETGYMSSHWDELQQAGCAGLNEVFNPNGFIALIQKTTGICDEYQDRKLKYFFQI